MYRNLAVSRLPLWIRLIACFVLLSAIAACGGRPTSYRATARHNPSRYYPPPGPSGDPWGPYIHEASGRFGVPELWIRRVMRQESGGQEDVISWAGAMGLMQVMPDTYEDLRQRYPLGDDPFDPHNNILAGAAYLREMYDRFGAPGFLAAYNAGPNRLDQYLAGGTPLPVETVNYVAAIAPSLGSGTPMSGPLAVYATSAGYTQRFAARASPDGCDTDAAYNPDQPCTPVQRAAVQPAVYTTALPAYSPSGSACDPDAAYDPTRSCSPAAATSRALDTAALAPNMSSGQSAACDPNAAYDPAHPCAPALPKLASPAYGHAAATTAIEPVSAPGALSETPALEATHVPSRGATAGNPLRSASERPGQPTTGHFAAGSRRPLQETVAFNPASATGAWGIQVGAYATLAIAQVAADNARTALPELLRTAKVELPATTPLGAKVAFRARLVGLSPERAANACSRLLQRRMACITVPPARDTF